MTTQEVNPRPGPAPTVCARKQELLVEALKGIQSLKLCGPSDDPDEQTAVTTAYRYLLVQIQKLATPLISEPLAVQLNAIHVDVHDLHSVYEANAELDPLIPDLENIIPSLDQYLSVSDLLERDEDDAIEFKSTARWDLKTLQKNKEIEDAVVKTIAGFLNTDGGTLLIGVDDASKVLGLSNDYAVVKPKDGDGFVNWITTHLIKALGEAAVMRTRARIVEHEGEQICRVDVSKSPRPVEAKVSDGSRKFFVRTNNSTRIVPDTEKQSYIADQWD